MKKTLLSILFLLPFISRAQTVSSSQMPNVGTLVTNNIDTSLSIMIINNGSNQIYDFTRLQEHYLHYLEFNENPRSSFVDRQFLSSNLKVSSGWSTGGSSERYFESNSNFLLHKGTQLSSMAFGKSNNYWIKLPLTVGSSWADTQTVLRDNYAFSYDPDGNGPLPKIDSFYKKEVTVVTLEGVSSGLLKLPNSSVNVIWQRINTLTDNEYKAYYDGAWRIPSEALLDALFLKSGQSSHNQYNAWSYELGSQSFVIWADEDAGMLKNIEWNPIGSTDINSVSSLSFELYPNPSHHILLVECVFKITKVYAWDMQGKKYPLTFNEGKVDIMLLPKGVFELVVESEGGEYIGRKRFVKI